MACSKSAAARTTFHLPIEITTDILSRLPVKFLLRFKSVCKNWYALIETPDLIAKHLRTHSALNSASLLLTTYNRETRNFAMSLLSDDGFSGPIDFPFLTDSYCPYFKWDPTRIAGICNGLVCIYISRFGYPLIICNPSTRKFREIPRNWLEENGSKGCISVERVIFGFGFHTSANDYKLIRIAVYYRRPVRQYQVRADLYAMSTDTWTEIDVDKLSLFFGAGDERGYNAYRHFGGSCASAVLNGVFYWPADEVRTHQMIVMSFDMGDEVFRQIRTPPCFSKKWDGTNFQFTEWKDKLALVISYSRDQCLDVWVLNEDQSSWTNQIKVGSVPRVSRNMGTGEVGKIRVVGCAKNGQLLVTNHKVSGEFFLKGKVSSDLKLFLYDPKTGETMDHYFGQVPYPSFINLYDRTLFPVMQPNERKH